MPRPPKLTFTTTDWDQPQTVTVTGLADDIDHVQQCTLPLQAVSGDANYDTLSTDVAGEVVDDDTVGVTITVPGGALNVAEHGATSDTYDVVLNSEPTGDVDIAVATVSADITVATVLTFTPANWDTPQTVVHGGRRHRRRDPCGERHRDAQRHQYRPALRTRSREPACWWTWRTTTRRSPSPPPPTPPQTRTRSH